MLKRIFWSKQMTWVRKLLGLNKPNIPWELEEVIQRRLDSR